MKASKRRGNLKLSNIYNMNSLKSKKLLNYEISKIDDNLSTSVSNSDLYNNDIMISENEIQNGEFYSHNEMKNKIENWKRKTL